MGAATRRPRLRRWRPLLALAAALAAAALFAVAHGRKRASAAEMQLARAFGYSERLIDKGIKAGSVRPLAGCSDPKNADFFSRFRTFEEIEAFLTSRICQLRQEIGSEGSQCEAVVIGTSVEGRPIYALEIRNPEALAAAKKQGKKERIALVTATLHAREWTATTSVLLSAVRLDVTDVSVVFVPVWNPDGYVHTWSGEKGYKKRWAKNELVTDEVPARMWRKNRKLNYDGTIGVDLNRNFGSSDRIWGTDKKSKSINFTESDIYQGVHGWSEPETSAIRDLHAKYKKKLVAFVDVHCCIGAILEPFSRDGKAPDYVFDIGQRMIDAINTKAPAEEQYEWRPRPASSASGSGISSSWAFQEALIPFTYVVELRSKFVMPCTEIKPIGNEFLLGLRVLIDELSRVDEIIAEYKNRPAAVHLPNDGAVAEARESRRRRKARKGALKQPLEPPRGRASGVRLFLYLALGSCALALVYIAKAKSEPSKSN